MLVFYSVVKSMLSSGIGVLILDLEIYPCYALSMGLFVLFSFIFLEYLAICEDGISLTGSVNAQRVVACILKCWIVE